MSVRGRRAAAFLAASLAAVLAATLVVVHSALVRRPLLDRARAFLAREAGLDLTVAELDYNLLARRVTVRGLRLAAVGHAIPIFTADEVEVRLPWAAYRGRLALQSVAIRGARVTIAVDADGTGNLPPGNEGPPPESPRRLDMRGLAIRDLDVEYVNARTGVEVRAVGLRADLEERVIRVFEGASGPFALAGVAVRAAGRETRSGPIEGRMAFDGSTVSLQDVGVSLPEADLGLRGRVLRALDAPALELQYEGVVRLTEAAAWGAPPMAVGGTASVEGTIDGPAGAPVIDVAYRAADLALGRARDLRVEGKARVAPGAFEAAPIALAAGAARVDGAVTVPFGEERPVRVEVSWRGLPIETALAFVERDPLPVAAALDGQLALAIGPGGALAGDVAVRARGAARPGALPVEGRVVVHASGGRWRAEADQRVAGAVQVTARAGGTVDPAGLAAWTLAGRLDAHVEDAGTLARALGRAGIGVPEAAASAAGRIAAGLALEGRIGAPHVAGMVTAENLGATGIGPARLTASIDATLERVRLAGVRVDLPGAALEAEVLVALPDGALGGRVVVEASELDDALDVVPQAWRPRGRARLDGTLHGSLRAPEAAVAAAAGPIALAGQAIEDLRAALRVSASGVEIDELRARQGAGSIEARGQYAWATGAYAAHVRARGLVLRDLLEASPETIARVALEFDGEGTVDRPFGQGRAEVGVEGGAIGDLIGRAAATLTLDGERARVTAHVPALGTYVDGTVAPRAPFEYRAVVVVHRLDLLPMALLAGAREGEAGGRLSLSALVTGRAGEERSAAAAINLQELAAHAGGTPLVLAAPARIAWRPDGVMAEALRLQVGRGELRAGGRLSRAGEDRWHTTFDGEAADLVAAARAFALVPDDVAASGRVRLDWTAGGGLDRVEASLVVEGGTLAWADLPPVEGLAVEAVFDGAAVDVQRIAGRWQGAAIAGTARLPRALFDRDAQAARAAPGAHGVVDARIDGLAPAALAPWVGAATLDRVSGRASVSLDAAIDALSLAGLRGALVVNEAAFAVEGVPVAQRRPSRAAIEAGRVRLEDVEWVAGGGPLRLAGEIDLTGERPVLELVVEGRADLRVISALLPGLGADGGADLDVRVRGPAAAPDLAGVVRLDGVELALRDLEIVLADLRGAIALDGRRLVVQEVVGDLNGGRLVVVGGLEHRAFELTGGTLVVQLQGAALAYPAGLQSEVDALLQFAPGSGGPRLFGDVRVLRSAYVAPISLPALVAAGRAPARPVRGEPAFAETIRLDVLVQTDSDLVVDNNYGRFEAGAELRLVGTAASPGLVGRATLREGGQVFLAGNTFRIERGSISFVGRTRIEPDFDIQVRTLASGRDVIVTLSGPLDRLETDVRSSDPDATTEELVGLLLGTGAGFGGADALRLFSAELLGATGRAFGLDSLRLERGLADEDLRADPGEIADQTDPSARLTLSKRIRPDVELTLSQNLRESGLSAIVSYRPLRAVELRGISRDNQDRAYALRHEIAFGGGAAARAAPPAPAPRVSRVEIAGAGVEAAALGRLLRLREGDRFGFHAWQRDIDALRRHLHDRGHFEARVRATRRVDEAASTVALVYRVEPGPVTVLEVEGYALPARVRADLERAWTRAIFDQFLAQDLARRTERHLVEQGLFGSAVRVEVDAGEEGRKTARVRIDPGVRVTAREIRFEGRRALAEERLRRAIDAADLAIDAWLAPERLRAPLEEEYAAEGYLDARVRPGAPQQVGDRAVLVVAIEEGPRYRVGGVVIEGAAASRLDALRGEIGLGVGDPYTAGAIDHARRRAEAFYGRRGFNAARVDVEVRLDQAVAAAAVAVVVDEGPQQILHDVAVDGASRTREGVVERALRLRVGEPVDLNEWALGRKRLYDTNVFRQVDLVAQPIAAAADGVEPVRARVAVQEWPAWRLRYGLQLNDERAAEEEAVFRGVDESGGRVQSLGLVADLRSQNLFGRAVAAGLAGRVDPERRSANSFLTFPSLARLPVTTSLFVFGSRETLAFAEQLAIVTDRAGLSVEQRWRRTRAAQVAWSYRFEQNHTFERDPSPFDPLPLDQRARVARLNLTGLVDRRDDPFDTRRGWFSSAAFEYADPALGSDLRLSKLFVQQKLFRPIGAVVAAGQVQAGAAFAAALIPSERFRAGGGTTVRGYAENALGPLDVLGLPRGGDAMLVLNGELRFPVFRRVRGVAFLDAGNVFAARRDLALADLRAGYGLGLRLDTPFALLRLDYGLPVARGPRDPRGRWYVGIGHIF